MNNFKLNTPVAFIIFNRPDTTIKVFEEIRKARPSKLLVIADGPRSNKPGEKERCEITREIINKVDWDCEVFKNYSDANLGCKKRVSSGISWVFDNVDEAIFLEDDCFPHQSFFRYCEELLYHYRNDERIMVISGDNFQDGKKVSEHSYYFSSYSHVWGWASWKRVWQKYDVEIKLWPTIKQNKFLEYWLPDKKAVEHWTIDFDKAFHNKIDTWDFQLLFTCWVNHGVTILPEVNLITNIGFGKEATHTKDAHKGANLPFEEISFPLKHPPYVMRNLEADKYSEKNHYLFSFLGRLRRRIKHYLETV